MHWILKEDTLTASQHIRFQKLFSGAKQESIRNSVTFRVLGLLVATVIAAAPKAVAAASYTFTNFDDPAATAGTFPYKINDSGQITGFYIDGSGLHGFLRNTDGTFTNFDDPQAV